MGWLTQAYVRRKQFEGAASLAAMGRAIKEGKHERIPAEAMLAQMGGF